jgi:hypothetical protein
MLTLKRFATLVDSYGGDLQRWPEEVREDAHALLKVSVEARALQAQAEVFDSAIGAARAREDAVLWPPEQQDIALMRLRSGVTARLASWAVRRPKNWRFRWTLMNQWPHSLYFRLAGMATVGGFAIMVGLFVGMHAVAPPTDSILAIIQPSPIHVLAD